MARKKKEQPKKDALTKVDIKRVCDILRRDDGVGAKDYIEQFSWLLFLRVFEGVESQLKSLKKQRAGNISPSLMPNINGHRGQRRTGKIRENSYILSTKNFFHISKLSRATQRRIKSASFFVNFTIKFILPITCLRS